jgi:methionyl-tRNA formyltransferase
MNMRIAVISDNTFLVQLFQELILQMGPEYSVDYFYSHQNSNPKYLVELGCSSIDLKADSKKIIDNYAIAFSLHCKQIFPTVLVRAVKCYNLHPGYNPFNRGWFPQVFSIINKLPIGATLHEIDEEIDNGPIIDQEPVVLDAADNSLSAYNKIMQAEKRILKRSLKKLLVGSFEKRSHEVGNYNSIKDYKRLLELNLNRTMKIGEVLDLLRALTHPPYKNAYFIDPISGKKYFVSVSIEEETTLER